MSSDPNIAKQRLEVAALRAMAHPVYEASTLETYYGGVAQQYAARTAEAQANIDKQLTGINAVYEKNPFVLSAFNKAKLDKKWADEDKRRSLGMINWINQAENPALTAQRRAKELADTTMSGLAPSVRMLYNADGTRRSVEDIGKSTAFVRNGMSWSDPNNPDPYNQVSGLARTLETSTWKTDVVAFGQQAKDAEDSRIKERDVSRAYQDMRFSQMKADKMSIAGEILNTYKGPDQIERPL